MAFLSRALILVCVLGFATAYYVPGTYPQEFFVGDHLQAFVNSLSSFETELPYEYYTLPVCQPPEGVKRIANTANLGTIIQGLRIENSPYNFSMMVKEQAKNACGPGKSYGPLTKEEVESLSDKIKKRYRINMLLDNLPVTVYDLLDENQEFVRPGFELGFEQDGKYYINNHLVFNILVTPSHGEYTRAKLTYTGDAADDMDARRHLRRLLAAGGAAASAGGAAPDRQLLEQPLLVDAATLDELAAGVGGGAARRPLQAAPVPGATQMYMVVGFEVSPCSIKRVPGKDIENVLCGVEGDKVPEPQEIVDGAQITYTYDVYWQMSKTRWASRWDAYLRMPGGKVHWFSIVNSILIVLVMATLVAMILIRTVRKDLAHYEQLVVDGNVDTKEEAGWKLLTGDVFRAPATSRALCVQVGSGLQVILVATTTMVLATLGFLSPASRGALLTTTVVLFVLLASVAGAGAVTLWGVLERSYAGWVRVALHVSLYFPGIVMLIFTLLNLAIKHTGSTGAVPVLIYFTIVAVWFLISVPLTFVGGYVSTRIPVLDFPVKTNQIPRQIPPPPVMAHSTLLFLASGILPFGTMFIELYFAMTSLWMGYFYYLFGFVLIIGLLTVVINAEISVLCTYVQLCAEDYQWWWRSFYRGGSVALYVALYALGFLASSLHSLAGALPIFLYLSYMSIAILGLYFAMGAVGFLASFAFVYFIFAAIKQD